MPELTSSEMLQPSLLDRLTDDEPDRQQESRDKRVLSLKQLRAAVLRDLSWLLNTASLDTTEPLDEYPHVAQSVLNFGLVDQTGQTGSSLEPSELKKRVREAILRFEPRILPGSLTIDLVGAGNTRVLEISGDLWTETVPDHLHVKTELDLEEGSFSVFEQLDRG